jgi:hypothetical protein
MTIKEKMKMIHANTTRKESFAGVTELGEFRYDMTNGKVPAGLDYHIHYTSDGNEVFMSGGAHNPDSRIINRVNGVTTLFSQYKKINSVPQAPYPIKIVLKPTANDYKTGYITRYFAQAVNEDTREVFETSKPYYEAQNTLYIYGQCRWNITGNKNTVAVKNTASAFRLNETLRGVTRILTPYQYWRPSSNSQDYLEKRLALRRENFYQ